MSQSSHSILAHYHTHHVLLLSHQHFYYIIYLLSCQLAVCLIIVPIINESLHKLPKSNTALIYCFATVVLNYSIILTSWDKQCSISQCVLHCKFQILLSHFRQAVQNSIILLSSKYHNSQPYILVQYNLNSLYLTLEPSFQKSHNTLLVCPMKLHRLCKMSSLSSNFDLITCLWCVIESTKSIGSRKATNKKGQILQFNYRLRRLLGIITRHLDFLALKIILYS